MEKITLESVFKFFIKCIAIDVCVYIMISIFNFYLGVSRYKVVDILFIILSLVQFIVFNILLFESQTHHFYFKRVNKAKQVALHSVDKTKLLEISKEYGTEYEIICDLLSNENLPSKIIDYWLFKGAWGYGLNSESCYGSIDVNQRLKLLELCIDHKNVSSMSLTTLSNKILQSKDCFVEKCYPTDDYYLINKLLENEKLPRELKKQLSKYLKRRKRNEKPNQYCDKDGFAYTIDELIDNTFHNETLI